jgi:hypothetical protein
VSCIACTENKTLRSRGQQLNSGRKSPVLPSQLAHRFDLQQTIAFKVVESVAMSESTPILDPPVENATSAAGTEGSAPPAAATDSRGSKENNGQDVTMAGLEDSGVKAANAKTGADPAVSDAICHVYHQCFLHPLGWHSPPHSPGTATMNYGSQLRNAVWSGLVWSVLFHKSLQDHRAITFVPQTTTFPPPQD